MIIQIKEKKKDKIFISMQLGFQMHRTEMLKYKLVQNWGCIISINFMQCLS
jgi:hypothetical protein